MQRGARNLLIVVAVFLGGCGQEAKTVAQPYRENSATAGRAGGTDGKKWGGWRWKGHREDCFFLFKNQCHKSLKSACKAAGCDKSSCEHDGSAPPHVTCKK